jgi:sulfur relay (sulfurtransferase) DsrF/TusC family protein
MVKSVLILCDKGPFGTNSAVEALRLGAGIMGLGDGISCKILFYGDGVLALKKGLAADKIGVDTLDEAFEMGDLTEMPLAIVKDDLASRGLTEGDIVEYANLSWVNKSEVPGLIETYETTFHI